MYSDKRLSDGPVDVSQHSADSPESAVRFTVLGTLGVLRGEVDCTPTAPKLLQLLALLVMRPAKLVQVDSITHELWPSEPPRTVKTTLHTYVYHLRRCFEQNSLTDGDDSLLITKAPGYILRIEPSQVDVHRFHRLQQEAHDLLRQDQHEAAAARLRAALNLWSGSPLANVHCGPILAAYAMELQEQRRNALHMLMEAEITSGNHRELIGELRSLTTDNPLDETLHGQLMRALGRSGRRSDAMAVYRNLRRRLSNELGVEPCDELQLLHHDLISEGDH